MESLRDIEEHIASTDRLNDDGVPSASIAFLEDPSATTDAYVITKGQENPETVYQACSISKAITALGVAKLVDQDRISYDTKVVDHVEEAVFRDIIDSKTAHLMQHVTVGLLVSHRSGLSQHGFPGYGGDLPSYEQLFAGRPPANTPRMRFLSFPGSQFSYSGGGFTVLQVLLEKVTGMPFAEFMQREVLDPLGMSRSRYGDLPAHEQNYALPYQTAYTPGTTLGTGYHKFTELAAAGLWTTPSDLLEAASAIQRSLHSNTSDETFLSKKSAENMLTRVSPNDTDNGMSLGWWVDETFFAHAGDNDPGYTCYLIAGRGSRDSPPDRGLRSPGQMSLAIMTNSSEGRGTWQPLVAAISAWKRWPLYTSLPCFGDLKTIIPYADREKPSLESWIDFIGPWKVDTEQAFGTDERAALEDRKWEVLEDHGLPYLKFGVFKPQLLRSGLVPSQSADGKQRITCLVVDGLSMALRLQRQESNGAYTIELVQKEVTRLRRVS